MGVFYIGDREGRGGVFRRLCVGMKINDLSLHEVELSGNNRCQQIEINTYPDSPLFISTGFLPRVSSKRLN